MTLGNRISFAAIRQLPPGSMERREAIAVYLVRSRGFTVRAAKRAGVNQSMVSRVLHGNVVSAPVEKAILQEERGRA